MVFKVVQQKMTLDRNKNCIIMINFPQKDANSLHISKLCHKSWICPGLEIQIETVLVPGAAIIALFLLKQKKGPVLRTVPQAQLRNHKQPHRNTLKKKKNLRFDSVTKKKRKKNESGVYAKQYTTITITLVIKES